MRSPSRGHGGRRRLRWRGGCVAYLDRSTPHATGRWVSTHAGAALRVYLLQGFYIVTYSHYGWRTATGREAEAPDGPGGGDLVSIRGLRDSFLTSVPTAVCQQLTLRCHTYLLHRDQGWDINYEDDNKVGWVSSHILTGAAGLERD
uniref:Uncharacterized protein n=1 Tax=Leersia perrieri TaxID=77586 RepID=A0A0D9W2Y8_9ORYZ